MNNLCKHSYPCMALHGGIDQYDRDSTILDFKNGNIKLMVGHFVILVVYLLYVIFKIYCCCNNSLLQ